MVSYCKTCTWWEYDVLCGSAYHGGGTCSYCTGNDPGGPGGPGGCSWSSKPTIASGTCTQANGLWGHYYRDNPVGEPRFDGGLKMERNDSTVNFDWSSSAPDSKLCRDNFSVNWTGYINLSAVGDWTIYIRGDDGMAVDIETTPGNWTRVVSDWSDHSAREVSGTLPVTNAGWYGIRVWYYENNSSPASAQLGYAGPGVAKTVVPATALRTCAAPTGTIQGYKVLMPGNEKVEPAAGQTVYLDAGSAVTTNPYSYTTTVGDHTVSVSTGGYLVQSTLCYNRIDCHTEACVKGEASCPVAGASANGSSRTVSVPSGGYADLWWHYTKVDPWLQVLNGDVHTNHLASLQAAPVGKNARWLISTRGSISGTSQENWLAQYYPERNFNLTQNTPIQAPTYANLWQRFGEGKTSPYPGGGLPAATGVYLISGNKTVNGVTNIAANRRILIFVDGNLTVEGEIRVPADSVIAFIVSGEINFSKSLAGGGASGDSIGGLFVAAGRINTAYDKSSPTEVTRKLELEGSLISLTDTLSLDRNLDGADNQTTPAESINLPAKYYVLLKSLLGRPKFFYREVPAGF